MNIANPNRFLLKEDFIFVMFANNKKTRKLFLFNDLLIIGRKDWRGIDKKFNYLDKHHVIEKTPLKDVRINDILDNTGSTL
jgi:hypothetical protein